MRSARLLPSVRRQFGAAVVMAALLLMMMPQARAGFVLGDAADFTILSYASSTPDFGDTLSHPATIVGNIGVGADTKLTIGGSSVTVTGQIQYQGSVVTSGGSANFAISGSPSINGQTCSSASACEANGALLQNQATVGTAVTAIQNLGASVGTLSASVGSITKFAGSQTVSLGSNTTYVAKLSGSQTIGNGMTLTLKGDSTDYFVFDIDGNFTGNGSGLIALDGVAPDHVLFDLTKTGSTVNLANNFIGQGTILALQSDINDNGTTTWGGHLFGGGTGHTLKVAGGATVLAPEIDASSGTAAIALLIGVLALADERRRARVSKTATG